MWPHAALSGVFRAVKIVAQFQRLDVKDYGAVRYHAPYDDNGTRAVRAAHRRSAILVRNVPADPP